MRWWVASVDAKDDVQLSPQLLDQAKQSFLKIRNTLRFLLGNLNKFSGVCVPVDTLTPMDRWIVHQAQTVHDAVVSEYNALAIHRAVQRIGQFCSGDLSAHYLDSVKDRLYCDAPQSHSRQCAQSTLVYLFELFIRMIAPILVFTAEDAYQYYKNALIYVFPSFDEGFGIPIIEAFSYSLPVICSDIPVFKEIGNDSVSYFKKGDFISLSKKIQTLIDSEDLRKELSKKGKSQLNKFSRKNFIKGFENMIID